MLQVSHKWRQKLVSGVAPLVTPAPALQSGAWMGGSGLQLPPLCKATMPWGSHHSLGPGGVPLGCPLGAGAGH